MKESNYHLFFGRFSTKLKTDVLNALMKKPMNVNELAEEIKAERSKVSHALTSLRMCRIVGAEKKGRERVYSITKDTVKPMLKLVDRHVAKYCKTCLVRKKRAKQII